MEHLENPHHGPGFEAGYLRNLEEHLGERELSILGSDEARLTAVMVTLQGTKDGIYEILFERRAATLRRQPGEISFPGGSVETQDANPSETALRETAEELGIQPHDIHLVGPLDVMVASSHLLVYPFVGILKTSTVLHPNPQEVDEILRIPLKTALEHEPQVYDVKLSPVFPENFPFHLIPGGRNYAWRTSVRKQYFYTFPNFVVWGLTAKILTHFLTLLNGQ